MEAIALGALSIPNAFAAVGMVAGVILSVGIGSIAIYTSYVVGQVKMRHPHVAHYADAVQLIWGRFGYELTGAMFVSLLILITSSHVLTGTIAWNNIGKLHLSITPSTIRRKTPSWPQLAWRVGDSSPSAAQ